MPVPCTEGAYQLEVTLTKLYYQSRLNGYNLQHNTAQMKDVQAQLEMLHSQPQSHGPPMYYPDQIPQMGHPVGRPMYQPPPASYHPNPYYHPPDMMPHPSTTLPGKRLARQDSRMVNTTDGNHPASQLSVLEIPTVS